MDSVSFFDFADSVEKKKMPADQIGTMFPICNVVSALSLAHVMSLLIWCRECNMGNHWSSASICLKSKWTSRQGRTKLSEAEITQSHDGVDSLP